MSGYRTASLRLTPRPGLTAGLALGLGLALGPAPAARADLLPVDLELVMAVDVSGSIDAEELQMQREGYIAAFADSEVVRAITRGVLGRIAVAYTEWGSYGHQRLVVDWMLIKDRETANAFSAALAAAPIRGGVGTSISGAIEFALPMFGHNGYEGTRKVIDISGDGPNNSGGLVTQARDRAAAAGVAINGLPIINDRPNRMHFPSLPDLDKYYEGCVITGEGSFVIVAGNFEAFGEAIRRKLILEIAGLQPGEIPGPRPDAARRYAGAAPSQGPLSARWRAVALPPRFIKAGAVYEKGCDIGERQLEEFYSRRGWNN